MSVLPPGLTLCPLCRQPQGRTTYGRRSLCFCEGLWCSYCHAGRIRRPISDHLDSCDGGWWHTPWFGYRAPCEQCQALGRTVEPGCRAWPGPLQDPAIAPLLGVLRDAAIALRTPTASLGELGEVPPGALVALHAPPEIWHGLIGTHPPHGRPLEVSAADTVRWSRRSLTDVMTVATWTDTGVVAVDAVEAELRRRWPAIPRRARRQNRASSRDQAP